MWYNKFMDIDLRRVRGWLYRNATPVKIIRGEEFAYHISDQEVEIANEVPFNIETYIKFCKRRGLKYDIDPYILCLLHEIGHDQTIFFLTSFKYNWDFLIAFLVERPSINYFMYWLRCQIYYRLPCEWAATEWAIDFINNNIKEVRELETYITEVKND